MSITDILFSFQGRINRAKWWLGAILGGVIGAVPYVAGAIMSDGFQRLNAVSIALIVIGVLIMIWTGLAAGVKRCHDRGKSGWWMLLALIPFIGSIWMFIELGILEGQSEPNQWGENPLAGRA